MKLSPLALLTIFAASSSAFGLNGSAKSVARATQSVTSFSKPALVQPVDIHGNRLATSVSSALFMTQCLQHAMHPRERGKSIYFVSVDAD